jgi:hypothetical protein
MNLFGIFQFANTQTNVSPLKGLEFILGEWKAEAGDMRIFENWKKNTDTTFVGTPFIKPYTDTIIQGKYTIAAVNRKIYYIT